MYAIRSYYACHAFFQFYVAEGRLSCQLYQRSADLFLGVPFNIASYALLTLMVAQVSGLAPGDFVHTLGDAHLYLNHLEQAREQVGRGPRAFPRMRLNPAVTDLFAFRYEDFTLEDYDPHPAIRITSYNVCYTKLLRLRKTMRTPAETVWTLPW